MHIFAKDFKALTGRDLPITGGMGQSRADAVVIDSSLISGRVLAPSIEYAVLDLIAYMKEDTYSVIEQRLLSFDGLRYDQLIVEWGEKPGQQFSFYFDITAVFGRRS